MLKDFAGHFAAQPVFDVRFRGASQPAMGTVSGYAQNRHDAQANAPRPTMAKRGTQQALSKPPVSMIL
jgi:hypothetical protein